MFKITPFALAVSGLYMGSARADDAEDKAVAFVEKLGGKVTRDEKVPGKPVVTVSLHRSEVTDAGLKELAPLKNLTELSLIGADITDAGLKTLAGFKQLTKVYLSSPKVTKEAVKELREALPGADIQKF